MAVGYNVWDGVAVIGEMMSMRSYVSELRRFIEVDVYGGCGRLKCPPPGAASDERCLDMLERRYFFYLAFENSLCVDYVTEKFWRTLRRDVVAVVLGAGDYSRLVPPPATHVDVRQFASPRHLADRLRALMTTERRSYAEMLRLKRRLRCSVDDGHSAEFRTRLCRYLDETDGETRTTDLELSWNARLMCTTPRSFYRGVADAIAY